MKGANKGGELPGRTKTWPIRGEMRSPESTQRASPASFGAERAGRWPDLDPTQGASQWLSRALALALHSFVLF